MYIKFVDFSLDSTDLFNDRMMNVVSVLKDRACLHIFSASERAIYFE